MPNPKKAKILNPNFQTETNLLEYWNFSLEFICDL